MRQNPFLYSEGSHHVHCPKKGGWQMSQNHPQRNLDISQGQVYNICIMETCSERLAPPLSRRAEISVPLGWHFMHLLSLIPLPSHTLQTGLLQRHKRKFLPKVLQRNVTNLIKHLLVSHILRGSTCLNSDHTKDTEKQLRYFVVTLQIKYQRVISNY